VTVSNGQLANQTTFNSSFMSREVDTDTVGRVDFKNAVPASGPNVFNIQRFLNAVASALGMTTAEVYSFLFTYSSDVVGAPNDTVLDRLSALTEKFRGGAGLSHAHTGADGQGEKISAEDLLDINNYFAEWQSITKSAVTGTTSNITTEMTGKLADGSSTQQGVIVDAPSNKVAIFDSLTGQQFEDSQGQKVFGRITHSAGVWTLTFYTNEAGVETSYNFTVSSNLQVFFLEVFTLETRPTIPSTPEFGSLDVTGDVVDASELKRGVVNLLAQSFAGYKTFTDGLSIQDVLELYKTVDSTTTGSDQTVTASQPFIVLTNASLSSISGILNDSKSRLVVVLNKTGNGIVLKHDDVAALSSNRILIPNGSNLDWPNNQAMSFAYDNTNSKWVLVGGTSSWSNIMISDSDFHQWWGGVVPVVQLKRNSSAGVIWYGSQDHDSGTPSGQEFVILGTGHNVGNSGGAQVTTGELDLTTGDADGIANTGPIYILSGAKTASATGGNTGPVFIQSGPVNGGNGDSGQFLQQSGNVSGSGRTGDFINRTGDSINGDSGDILFETGSAPGGTRGTVFNRGRIAEFEVDEYLKVKNGKGLRLFDSDNSNYSGFKAHPTTIQDREYVLPPSDGSSGQVISTDGSGNLSWTTVSGGTPIFGKQTFTLNGTDITNQYVDLSQVILANSLDFMLNGLIYREGADYSVSLTGGVAGKTRVTFLGDLASGGSSALASGDIVYVKYNY
jgi:hypothetical protein